LIRCKFLIEKFLEFKLYQEQEKQQTLF